MAAPGLLPYRSLAVGRAEIVVAHSGHHDGEMVTSGAYLSLRYVSWRGRWMVRQGRSMVRSCRSPIIREIISNHYRLVPATPTALEEQHGAVRWIHNDHKVLFTTHARPPLPDLHNNLAAVIPSESFARDREKFDAFDTAGGEDAGPLAELALRRPQVLQPPCRRVQLRCPHRRCVLSYAADGLFDNDAPRDNGESDGDGNSKRSSHVPHEHLNRCSTSHVRREVPAITF